MKKSSVQQEITPSEALKALGEYVPDIAFTVVTALYAINPIWAVLFYTGKGIFGAWADFGKTRMKELAISLEDEKDSFIPEIIESNKFKGLFLETLDRHMKETSEEKRALLRRYLIAVAQGKHPEFDYHTKLLNILEQITGDEFRLFMLLPTIIQDWHDESVALSNSEHEREAIESRNIEMNTMQVIMRLKDWDIKKRKFSALLRFLNNYGLIVSHDTSTSGIGGGGSNDLIFSGLSEAGKVFYDFMDDPNIVKEITDHNENRANPGRLRQYED